MKKSLLFLFSVLCLDYLSAQQECRENEYQQHLLQLHPALALQYNQVEAFIKQHPFELSKNLRSDTFSVKPVPAAIVIPVVVHILWNNSRQNLSDAQVISQIDALNKDYGALNPDRNKIPAYFSSLAADCGISFVLAKTDPQGHATSGIVRTQTGTGVFGFDDKVKTSNTQGDDAWNADSYLNIWVCNLVNGISGYASAPGGPKELDGVVIASTAFGTINTSGPYNKGRTAVHEIGHWLNLRHTWGDASCGDDKVDDTPSQQGPNRGCNSGEKFSCGTTEHGDMYMNYMDFSDDACMYMFTNGQRNRMRALFEQGGPRCSLLFSSALEGTGLPAQQPLLPKLNKTGVELLLYPNPATGSIALQLQENTSGIGKKIIICNQLGQIVQSVNCTMPLQQLDISALRPGLYYVRIDGMQTNALNKFIKQ